MKKFELIVIFPESTIKQSMKKINQNGVGSLIVINKKFNVLGVLTDGDIRRAIFADKKIDESIKGIYSKKIIKYQESKFNIEKLEKKSLEKNLNIIPILKKNKLVDFYSIKSKTQNKNSVKTVIMAGGLGTRMKPFTDVFPKPMLPINNQTMIEIVINQFKKYGLSNFIFTINYKSDLLSTYLKTLSSQINVKYKILKENKRLGTAGSLKFLKKKLKKDFFVTNCDTILKANLNDIYQFHVKNRNDITIIAAVKNETIPYGVLKVSKNQIFSKIFEKPKNSYIINTGVYVFNPAILNLIPKKNEIFDMNQLISISKIKKKKIKVYLIDGDLWHDVGQTGNYHKYINDNKIT